MASTESIALSALATSQRLLDLTGQNLANVQTPGYHRQVANLATRGGTDGVGLGVQITDIRRQIDQALEDALTRSTSSTSDLSAQLDALRQIESQINPGDGSIHDLLEQFFNQVQQLASQPEDTTQRRVVLNTAAALTDKLNSVFAAVQQSYGGIQQHIDDEVAQINQLTGRIARLNAEIQRATLEGGNPNNLSDQRDDLIKQLAQLIDVRVVPQDFGSVNVLAAGVPLVLADQTLTLGAEVDKNNQVVITAGGLPRPLAVTGGKLHGDLTLRNQTLAAVVQDLTNLTRTFAQAVDEVQATGLGQTGPFSILYGQRSVSNINVPLAQAGLAFPPSAGSLFVSVTDLATGERTLQEITIDPATQSLQDVANLLGGVGHLQAVIDPDSRALTIVAQPGYAFDFAGRLATAPETSAITGTAVPQIGGTYTGADNDNFTFSVVGSGTVGLTPNLTLEARNSAGALIGSWNIGEGYEPGSDLSPIQGVSVRLSAGTVNDGDSFTSLVVANSDTAGILPALGLNSFFTGGLGDLHVRSDLLDDPGKLSASLSDLPADGANLQKLIALRDERLLANGADTFSEFYANLTADVGSQVQDLEQRQAAEQTLNQGLAAQQQGISGVDPNEELVRMVQYQRSFQLSARFMSTVNDTLDDLLKLV